MLIRLLAAFILIPFVELVLLLRMADATSWLTTLTIVILTGILGSFLARREGLAAIGRFREALAEGRMPGREIQDGLMIAFAAALLLTPGLLTDALGFLLLTPWGRARIGRFLRNRYAGKFEFHASGFSSQPNDEPVYRPDRDDSASRYTVDSPSYGPRQPS